MIAVNEKLTDVDEAFPADVSEYMPAYNTIPEYEGRREREDLVQQWFSYGLANTQFRAKEGVPGAAAFRQLKCIMGSFQPKHEHKIAAVAYLLNEWFHVESKNESSV